MPVTHYTYRFRLYPTKAQENLLARHFGACRFVYNHFLARRMKMYEETGKGSSYAEDCRELTKLRKELVWLSEVSVNSLQQSLMNLDAAFKRFFKKISNRPKFHSKHSGKNAYREPSSAASIVRIQDGRLLIAKFREGIKICQHRSIEGKIKRASVSRNKAGQYYVAILTDRNIDSLPTTDHEVGIDLGLKTLATLSDGKTFENIRPYQNLERRLKRLNRELCRRVKGSKSREKTRKKFARLHQRIVDIRKDYLHKISHQITSENQAIYLEDLNVEGMKANRSLARSVYDVSFAELVRQLEYKAKWRGRTFIKVSRFFPSSKTCSCCGFVHKGLTMKERTWVCEKCNTTHERDLNAATNILNEGKRTVRTTGIAGGERQKTSARKQHSEKPETVITLQAKASEE